MYVIKCQDGSLYTGITTDLVRRFAEHQKGKGGHYTKSKGVEKLLYTEKSGSRSAAQKREAEIKSWPREKKLRLISTHLKQITST